MDRLIGSYFEKPTDKKEKETFDLRETVSVTDTKDTKESKNEFVLALKSRTMTLRAGSPIEKTQWLNVLKSFEGLGNAKPGVPIPVPQWIYMGLVSSMDFINAYGECDEQPQRLSSKSSRCAPRLEVAGRVSRIRQRLVCRGAVQAVHGWCV